jgi:predicted nucleic acid-binding protein
LEAVIDANALVYDYVEDSRFHQEAREALDGADGWVVPSVVLEEFVFVMMRAKVDDGLVRGKIDELLNDRRTAFAPVGAADVKSSLRFLSSENASSSRFNDELVLSIASRKKIPLMTFDKELQGQSKRFGVKVVP